MARPEDAKMVKAMKEARTAEEKIKSWGAQTPGRDMRRSLEMYRLFIERRPDIIENFTFRPYREIVERGILDRKTRELCFLAVVMAMNSVGVISHCQNAKAAGITEEEILEVASIVCYGSAKGTAQALAGLLKQGFEAAASVTVDDVSGVRKRSNSKQRVGSVHK